MAKIDRRRFLFLTGVAGVASLAGCQEMDPGQGGTPSDDTDSLGLGLSKSGPGELSDSDEVRSGWVHLVAHGETYDVTFDARVCHSHQDEVEVDLTEAMPNEYVLEFSTNGGAESKFNCDYGTRFTGGGIIPTDFESLRITVNGGTIQTVEKEGTMPILRPLPDPVET